MLTVGNRHQTACKRVSAARSPGRSVLRGPVATIAAAVPVFLFAPSGMCQAPANAPAVLQEEQITLRRIAPTDFYDPNFSTDQLSALLSNSLPRVEYVRSGETLSDVLSRVLNISQSFTPAVYDQVTTDVLTRNNISLPKDLKPGPLLLPDLPRTAKPEKTPGNTFYEFPRISSGLSERPMVWDSRVAAMAGWPKIDDRFRQAVTVELQSRTVPRSEARKYAALAKKPPDVLRGQFMYVAANEHVRLKLGAEAGPPGPEPLVEKPVAEAIAARLKTKRSVNPLLVVLDDSWPDDAEYAKAMQFVARASRRIREHFRLESPLTDSADVRDVLSGATKTEFYGIPQYPALKLHSAMIKAALNEFVTLDAASNINVVFLPVNRAQPGALHAIREIIYVAELARPLGSALGKTHVRDKKPATEFANRIVSGLSLSGTLTAYDGTAHTVSSDKAVIESVWLFLALYAEAVEQPYFLSLSWTIPDMEFQAYFKEKTYGMMLAAAGNDKGKDVYDANLQFALRSVRPGDVLAVVNADSAGLSCSSNTLPSDVRAFGLAFPGKLKGALCGTSFSAPRIAWLLAARAALGQAPPNSPARQKWAVHLRDQLMALQNMDVENEGRFVVTLERLLGM